MGHFGKNEEKGLACPPPPQGGRWSRVNQMGQGCAPKLCPEAQKSLDLQIRSEA